MPDPATLHAGRTGRVTYDGRDHDLHVVELGVLQVPSGRLGASDPFVNLAEPLEVVVPPGSYPVSVTVADVSEALDGSHLREAYLSVWVREGAPARVEVAVPPGRETPPDGEHHGVGVDAGTVAFADVDAVVRCMPGGDWYEDLFDPVGGGGWFGSMGDPEHHRDGCANIVLPLATRGENVVLSHSGWGDGFYPVLLAFDDAFELLSVHIDLQVVS